MQRRLPRVASNGGTSIAMDRFVSTYTTRLDAKGRVSVPAPYRTILAKDGFEGAYFLPAIDTPTIDCGGQMLMNEIYRLIDGYPAMSVERDDTFTALLGPAEQLKFDPEGRVMLSETLKAHAQIKDALTFVGLGYKFQIWEPERFRAHLDEAKTRVRELRRRLGNPDVASRTTGARE